VATNGKHFSAWFDIAKETGLVHSYLHSYLNVVVVSAHQRWSTSSWSDVRNKHFVISSIDYLVENVEAQNIIDFIKETRFYKQL